MNNYGGPAFPQITEFGDIATTSNGMTLRDYFAGQALGECMVRTWAYIEASQSKLDDSTSIFRVSSIAAYEAADAMLVARGGK